MGSMLMNGLDGHTTTARRRRLRSAESNFSGARADEALWGGAEAARIASRFLDAATPVVEAILGGHAAGRIRQDIIYLFWSYAHMFTNRLGIESAGEAVLRFFLHRLIEERGAVRV